MKKEQPADLKKDRLMCQVAFISFPFLMLQTQIIVVNYTYSYWNGLTPPNQANLSLWILLTRNDRSSLEWHNDSASSALTSQTWKLSFHLYPWFWRSNILLDNNLKKIWLWFFVWFTLIFTLIQLSTTLQQEGLEPYTYLMFQIATLWSLSDRKDKISSSFPLKKNPNSQN